MTLPPRPLRAAAAFTMVEIAVCLAIIAFALVAIIGVLPMGLGVQKENREETIINQDAGYFMDAIRSGARGLDDLTNYVFAITNYWTAYNGLNGSVTGAGYDGYSYSNSVVTSLPPVPSTFSLTNGSRIIGLLSTPTFTPVPPSGSVNYYSNYVVAFVRALSGPAVEKFPQNNPITLDMAFGYRMICQNEPVTVPLVTDLSGASLVAAIGSQNLPVTVVIPTPRPPPGPALVAYLANFQYQTNQQNNAHELRLRFLWPLLPGGNTGDGRQTFRTLVSGSVLPTSDPYYPGVFNLYFFQSRSYQ